MDWLCNARAARLAAALLALVTITGCPELNQWSPPAQDPFFSVPDPAPSGWNAENVRPVRESGLDDEAVE